MSDRGSFTGHGMPPQQQTPRVKISPNDLKTLTCEYCQGSVFAEGLVIKTVSPLLTENGKEGMMPIPAFYCVACHKAVQKYLPEELREKKVVTTT